MARTKIYNIAPSQLPYNTRNLRPGSKVVLYDSKQALSATVKGFPWCDRHPQVVGKSANKGGRPVSVIGSCDCDRSVSPPNRLTLVVKGKSLEVRIKAQ